MGGGIKNDLVHIHAALARYNTDLRFGTEWSLTHTTVLGYVIILFKMKNTLFKMKNTMHLMTNYSCIPIK